MKRNIKKILYRIAYFSMITILVSLVFGAIGVEIYVLVTYANVPITEIPAWALIFMFRGFE